MKNVWFDELLPYPIRSFTYHNEQVRVDKVSREIMQSMFKITVLMKKLY
jgi:hypothetical protein